MTRPPDVQSLVGYTIGKCKLLRVCGRGAMGTVYEGMHTGLDIDVAVKVLPPHLAANGNLVQRFLREAKLAAKLNHPNTVRVYDVGEESGYYYLVMEFVKGSDALQLVKSHGPQSSSVVADIGAGAARALTHAHAAEVVHRDIKPANLMLPETGGVKVADFGLARALASDSGLTMTGAVMGTPDYMAPEQAQGKMAGPPADAYSLGATLYHLFVGRPPYQATNPMAVALMHVTNRVVVPEERMRDEADRALAKVITDLTEKDANRRPSDMAQIAERLSMIARMRRKPTQKLLSEGGTLFDTAGVKLQTKMWEAAQFRAGTAQSTAQSTAPTQPGTRPPTATAPIIPSPPPVDEATRRKMQPTLDELRKAAASARNKGGDPDSSTGVGPMQDVSDLTPELVREAKARARRSSGTMSSLPAEMGGRGGEGERNSGGSSRRGSVAAGSNLEDAGWEEYSAKAFPTFDRDAVVAGTATRPQEDNIDASAPWETKKSAPPPGMAPGVPVSGDMISMTDRPRTAGRKRKRGGGGLGLLVVLLLIGGAAFAAWHFYLDPNVNRPPADGGSGGPIKTFKLVSKTWQGHKDSVTGILVLNDGVSFITCSADGSVCLWQPSYASPTATYAPGGMRFTRMAIESDETKLAVATDDGRVVLLNAHDLKVLNPEVMKVANITDMVWPASFGLIVSDDQGNLNYGSSKPFAVGTSGSRISAITMHGDLLWVTNAAKEIKFFDLRNEPPKAAGGYTATMAVDDLVSTPVGVVGVAGSALHLISDVEVKEGVVKTSLAFTCAVRDEVNGKATDGYVAAVNQGKLGLYEPRGLREAASIDLPGNPVITSISRGPMPGSVVVGTRDGSLILVTPGP